MPNATKVQPGAAINDPARTVPFARDYLGLKSDSAVYRLMNAGKLRFVEMPQATGRPVRRIRQSELERFLSGVQA